MPILIKIFSALSVSSIIIDCPRVFITLSTINNANNNDGNENKPSDFLRLLPHETKMNRYPVGNRNTTFVLRYEAQQGQLIEKYKYGVGQEEFERFSLLLSIINIDISICSDKNNQ
ncbi:unnamed protein product [Rotaria socialis]